MNSELFLAAVTTQNRTGPTIVFVITILVVVVLLGATIRRASSADRESTDQTSNAHRGAEGHTPAAEEPAENPGAPGDA